MKYTIVTTALLLLSLNIWAQNPYKAEEFVNEGIELRKIGNHQAAIQSFEKALEMHKPSFDAKSEMAKTYFSMQDYPNAERICKMALEMHKHSKQLEEVYITYGNSLDYQGKQAEAIQMYEEGITNFPQSHLLHYNKGLTLLEQKSYEEAEKSFQNAVKHESEHAASHFLLGLSLYGQDKQVPAILVLTRYFMLDPAGPYNAQAKTIYLELFGMNVMLENKNEVSIYVEPKNWNAGDSLGLLANDFRTAEILLRLSAATDFDSSKKKVTTGQKIRKKLDMLLTHIQENQVQNTGFYWKYYGTFYAQILNKQFKDPLLYVITSAIGEEKEYQKWVQSGNRNSLDAFYEWSGRFRWKW